MRRSRSVGIAAFELEVESARSSDGLPLETALSHRAAYAGVDSSVESSVPEVTDARLWRTGVFSSFARRSESAAFCARISVMVKSASMRANFSRSSPLPKASTLIPARPVRASNAASARRYWWLIS